MDLMPVGKSGSLHILVSVYSELCGTQRVESLKCGNEFTLRYTDTSCTTASYVRVMLGFLTHLGLTLFCRSPPGPIREIEGFVTHICVTREMRAVFQDAYMRHQAKMS